MATHPASDRPSSTFAKLAQETSDIPTFPHRPTWVVTLGAGGTGSPKVVAVAGPKGNRIGVDVAGRGVKLLLRDAILGETPAPVVEKKPEPRLIERRSRIDPRNVLQAVK